MKPNSLLLGLAALLCAGCQTIPPIYEIDSDAYLVVKPVHDPLFGRSAWDSPTGHDIAMRVTALLSGVDEFEVVPYSQVKALLSEPPDEHGQHASDSAGLDVRELTDTDLADLTGADYVLVCRILELRTQDPKSFNMIQGTARVQVELFDVHAELEPKTVELDERQLRIERARERHGLLCTQCRRALRGGVVANAVVTATFPDERLDPTLYGDPFLSEALVRQRLVERISTKIAQLLYERDPEE